MVSLAVCQDTRNTSLLSNSRVDTESFQYVTNERARVCRSKVFFLSHGIGTFETELGNMRAAQPRAKERERERPPTAVACQFLFLVSTRVIFAGVD